MPSELTLRRYRPADADEVWNVHEAALRASPLPFVEDAPADEDLEEIEDHYLAAGGEFLVGELGGDADGAVVAVGGFQPRGDDVAEIRRMRVHPDHQREGYARALLEALETRARERGFERLVLETSEHLTAAREFYAARGYEQTGREPHPVTGDDLLSFGKDL